MRGPRDPLRRPSSSLRTTRAYGRAPGRRRYAHGRVVVRSTRAFDSDDKVGQGSVLVPALVDALRVLEPVTDEQAWSVGPRPRS